LGSRLPGHQTGEAQGREQAQERPPRGATAERDGEAIELLGVHYLSSTDAHVWGICSPLYVGVERRSGRYNYPNRARLWAEPDCGAVSAAAGAIVRTFLTNALSFTHELRA
jgi:hypothetical protein